MMSEHYEWVDNDQRLKELSTQWQSKEAIALDTEFIRSRTFYPKIGLLQIADDEGIYLVDPLKVADKECLKALMLDASVTKVIHSCSEDLEVFQHYLGCLPVSLFDTQIASAFVGIGSSIGYANLILLLEEQSIPKQETRSDWLQRPLSQSQLEYAALDVKFLLSIYQKLNDQLNAKDRLHWLQADCQQLLDKYKNNDDFENYYRRVKSAWKLKPEQLAILKALCAWREQETRAIDIPRNHLIKDATLLEISRYQPENKKELKRIKEISNPFVEAYGEYCIELIEQVIDEKADYPKSLPKPFGSEQRDLFKVLKAKVNSIAESLNMPPEFIARKNDLENLVRLQHQGREGDALRNNHDLLPKSLRGWRLDIVGQPLLKLVFDEIS